MGWDVLYLRALLLAYLSDSDCFDWGGTFEVSVWVVLGGRGVLVYHWSGLLYDLCVYFGGVRRRVLLALRWSFWFGGRSLFGYLQFERVLLYPLMHSCRADSMQIVLTQLENKLFKSDCKHLGIREHHIVLCVPFVYLWEDLGELYIVGLLREEALGIGLFDQNLRNCGDGTGNLTGRWSLHNCLSGLQASFY
jgi:hypothetical protein